MHFNVEECLLEPLRNIIVFFVRIQRQLFLSKIVKTSVTNISTFIKIIVAMETIL